MADDDDAKKNRQTIKDLMHEVLDEREAKAKTAAEEAAKNAPKPKGKGLFAGLFGDMSI